MFVSREGKNGGRSGRTVAFQNKSFRATESLNYAHPTFDKKYKIKTRKTSR